ncbi:MAG: hypothetical protein DHS20C18_00150 [Saprospiraceae bacterium]|nr:MAG: hypothetical protein DHS20C18_00150 [Saprospiraceae bacterium]
MTTKSDLSTHEKAEKLITEFFDRVWHSPHELDAIDEMMTEDYTITTAGSVVKGRDAFKNWVKRFQQLLLDAKTESEEIFFDETKGTVISRWICSGRNNGLFGLEPDHQFVSFSGIAIWTIRGNKLAECWAERSAYELFTQLTAGSEKKQFV